MSMDGMKDVEVPQHGTVVVQDGDVHDVFECVPEHQPCWCTDGMHRKADRVTQEGERHLIGIQKFEMVWEAKK